MSRRKTLLRTRTIKSKETELSTVPENQRLPGGKLAGNECIHRGLRLALPSHRRSVFAPGPLAFASVEIISPSGGQLGVTTLLCTTVNCIPNPDCSESAEGLLEAPIGDPSEPPTASAHASQCSANGSSVGPVDVQGTFAGDTQSMTLTMNGSGSANFDSSKPPESLIATGGVLASYSLPLPARRRTSLFQSQ